MTSSGNLTSEPHSGIDDVVGQVARAYEVDPAAVVLTAFAVLAARRSAESRVRVDVVSRAGTTVIDDLPLGGPQSTGELLRAAQRSLPAVGEAGARLTFRTHNLEVGYEPPGLPPDLDARLRAVLGQILIGSAKCVADLDTVTAVERAMIIDQWSRGAEAPSDLDLLPQMVARWTADAPDQPAVMTGNGIVTFGKLGVAVDRLADRLRAYGITRGDRVAVSLPRSPALIVALLAVLRAGAAYVPLDPSAASRHRTELILLDCGSRLVITSASNTGGLQPPLRMPVLTLDETGRPNDPVDPRAGELGWPTPHDVAYVMYTSGSTGQPKGVMITHGSLANYLRWCVDTYLVSAGGGPVFSSVAFDLTVSTMFGPLMAGRPVILADDDADFDEVAGLLRRHRPLAFLKLTPTHADLLHRLSGEAILDVAGCVVIGGEALTADIARPWRTSPATRVINEYGPTEACVANITHVVEDADEAVPVGRPIPGTEAYVLDGSLRLLPPGELGEIHLGGVCLAWGYFRRPAMTATRFVPHPLRPGERLYRTGDLGFWNGEGQLVYQGRIDDQIKIRGYRVEPGEIETFLRSHPMVAEAAVTVTTPPHGRPALTAYVVPRGDQTPSSIVLRRFLATMLPDHLVPTNYRWTSQLPMTGNGKVDRAGLGRLADVAQDGGLR